MIGSHVLVNRVVIAARGQLIRVRRIHFRPNSAADSNDGKQHTEHSLMMCLCILPAVPNASSGPCAAAVLPKVLGVHADTTSDETDQKVVRFATCP